MLLKKSKNYFYAFLIVLYNAFIDLKPRKKTAPSDFTEFDEVMRRSIARTDINDHIPTLFIESLLRKPEVIVELGVRGGESTFALERVAKLCKSKLISVDIEDCSGCSKYKDWIFVHEDDIPFAKHFIPWCREHHIPPRIDVLFIDTSHVFEHTLQEIKSFFPYLSDNAKVFFHDTNLRGVFSRKDGSRGLSWNNERGVIRALEVYFKASFNERRDFIVFRKGWAIKHYANCNGFTILEKIGVPK